MGPVLLSIHGCAVPAVSRDGPGYGGPSAHRAASPAESDKPAGVAGVRHTISDGAGIIHRPLVDVRRCMAVHLMSART